MSSHDTKNPNGGVTMRHVMESPDPNENSLPGYGPVISVNRPLRTRMRGGVGAGGEKPPATRLGLQPFKQIIILIESPLWCYWY